MSCSCSFGIWSDAIKKQYNLSQLQVAGIGTAGNVGGYMAIFAGLLYDWLRGMNRYPPLLNSCYTRRDSLLFLARVSARSQCSEGDCCFYTGWVQY